MNETPIYDQLLRDLPLPVPPEPAGEVQHEPASQDTGEGGGDDA